MANCGCEAPRESARRGAGDSFVCGVGARDTGDIPVAPKGRGTLDDIIDDAIARARSTIIHPAFGELPVGPWSGPALTRNLRRALAAGQDVERVRGTGVDRSHGFRSSMADVLRARTAPTRFAAGGRTVPPEAGPGERRATKDADDLRVGPGHRELESTLDGEVVEFHLGDVHLTFPLQWLYDHWRSIVDGTGPTQADIVEAIWGDVADSVRANGDASEEWAAKVMEKRIGCVNMPMDPTMWLFYQDGGGAPEAVILNTLRLIHANLDSVQDRFSGTDHGEGYAEFWGELLGSSLDLPDLPYRARHLDRLGLVYPSDWPGPARSELHDYHPGERRDVRLHFVSEDERYNGEDWADFGACGLPKPQDLSSLLVGWRPWDWEGGFYSIADACVETGGSCPAYSVRGLGSPGAFAKDDPDLVLGHSFMKAQALQGTAFISDELMFWARAALAFYWDSMDYPMAERRYESHFLPAWWLGRMVLHYLVKPAYELIHEVGHVFNMTGHCSKGCFMELAGYEFQLAVTARYGIPIARVDYLYSGELPQEVCVSVGFPGSQNWVLWSDGGCLGRMSGVYHLESEGTQGSDRFLCLDVQNVDDCLDDEWPSMGVSLSDFVAAANLCGEVALARSGTSNAPYSCRYAGVSLDLFDTMEDRWAR